MKLILPILLIIFDMSSSAGRFNNRDILHTVCDIYVNLQNTIIIILPVLRYSINDTSNTKL